MTQICATSVRKWTQDLIPVLFFLSLYSKLFFYLFSLFPLSFVFSLLLSSHSALLHPPSSSLLSSTATIITAAETHKHSLDSSSNNQPHADRGIFQGRTRLLSTVHACMLPCERAA